KFVSSKSKCYDKCNQNVFKAKIPEGSCNPPTPSDAATVACIQKAEAKNTQLIDKVCFTPPATPPACYDGSPLRPNSGAGWTPLGASDVRARKVASWRGDALAMAALAVAATVVWLTRIKWPIVAYGIGSGDAFCYFLPAYEYEAARLRVGTLPLWNPYQGAGI